ncbi:MAG TPA: arginine decarboxylase, partial [Ohtaekwangia sp.]|nr:arginine decarboxylase [Ohtaekwangia sp.]
MKSYRELIEQTFEFPQKEFKVRDHELLFNDVPLMEIINQHGGTPIKLTYLPRISENIRSVQALFNSAMEKFKYNGKYTYCYCTKSSHFSFVLEEALKNRDVHIETSSSFDIPIVRSLFEKGKLTKDTYVICNGFKMPLYTQYITEMLNDGFVNVIPILDKMGEIEEYEKNVKGSYQVGIRVASDEEPKFEFYTSRLGIRYSDINNFYKEKIENSSKASLKMLHFFINTGIKDTAYYWSELSRFIFKYCDLKKICPTLDSIDIGGGFPIKTSLTFQYDYRYMIEQIVENIKWICDKSNVPVPNIFTEFGSYTVGESGAVLYKVID